jgi:hypothetical protein
LALEFSRISGRPFEFPFRTVLPADRRRPAMIVASFKTSLGSVVDEQRRIIRQFIDKMVNLLLNGHIGT